MKRPVRNNFPREGEHNTVTAEDIERMERERPQHNPHLDYTIGGSVEAHVHTSIEAEREYAINRGHRILNQAANDLGNEFDQSAHKPLAIDFNMIREEAQAHIDSQAESQSQSEDQGETP